MDATPAIDDLAGDVEELLEHLRDSRGFDFGDYKRTSLLRRIQHRMKQLGVASYAEYIDRLQVDADEFTALFNTILINVTGFFRDPEAWDRIRSTVLPEILAEKAPGEPIRVWSAGCSSGQEAYSVAILLAEALGPERYLEQVKIYATDIDDEALMQARHAVFDETETRGVPDDLKSAYFERRDRKYAFRPELRRTIIFGRNDLVQDAPISRIDLLICRNTLMYFNAEAQSRILGRFHFALVPRGVLFLGKAEMLLSHGHLFEPLDLKRRIFRRVPNPLMAEPRPPRGDAGLLPGGADRLRDGAFAASPVAHFVVTADDDLALFNQQAGSEFGLAPGDIGKPLRDLEISYRPVELRGHLTEAKANRRSVRIKDVELRRPNGVVQWYEVQVNPLVDGSELLGTSFVFDDVTVARALQRELERANLQLEHTNEELQSTNEELETTNEELQSTVEELETTNEELQCVVVIDREMRVLAWNAGAQELWGLRPEEAEGQHLLNLDVGLPMQEVRPIVREALSDASYVQELRLHAVNRRGRSVDLRMVCSSLHSLSGQIRGALLVMEAAG